MSITQQFRGAVRRFRDAFELTHLYPGARIAERARAEQKDYEIRLRDLREREAAGETYGQAMARLTGAEPTAFELEPGDWTPPADPRLDSFGPDYDQAYALATPAEREQLAAYGVIRTPADPAAETVITTEDPWAEAPEARTMTDIVNDRNAGRISRAEYERQETARVAEVGGNQAWDELMAAPRVELSDAEINAIEADQERQELETLHREPGWADLGEEARLEYLADRAAGLAEMDEFDARGRADVIARMACDGLSGDQVAQVVETARTWQANEATAEHEAARTGHEAVEAARGLLALHDEHQAAWHKVGDLRREPVDSPAYQAAITEAKAKDAAYRDALDATQAAGVRLPGEDPQQFAVRVAGGQIEYDSSGCNGYAVPGGEAAADKAGSGFMGAPVPEEEEEAGQDWRAAEDQRLAGERAAEREASSYPERFEEAYGPDPEPDSDSGEPAFPGLDEDWPGLEPVSESGRLPRGVTPVVNDRGVEIHVVDPAQLGEFLADVNAGAYGQPEADREAGQ